MWGVKSLLSCMCYMRRRVVLPLNLMRVAGARYLTQSQSTTDATSFKSGSTYASLDAVA